MKEPRLTLAQLAHFDRCIFPDDFARDLRRFGVEEIQSIIVARYIADTNNTVGIVKIAHEWRKFPDVSEAIRRMLNEWDERFPDKST